MHLLWGLEHDELCDTLVGQRAHTQQDSAVKALKFMLYWLKLDQEHRCSSFKKQTKAIPFFHQKLRNLKQKQTYPSKKKNYSWKLIFPTISN